MYRTPAEQESEGRPPRTFVYNATDETAGRADGMVAMVRYFSVPLLASGAITWLGGPVLGVAALAGTAAFSVWSFRSRKRRDGAVLTVDDSVLIVEVGGKRAVGQGLRLSELRDVALDIKTIERVMEGSSAIPGMRFIDSKVAPKVDTARIVLIDDSGHEVPLTREYLPHMHATQSLGQIRTFLRKHGWVPEDEREPS